jgi:hypothetical protein
LLCLISLAACPYSFTLDGKMGQKNIALEATANNTHLLNAGVTFDTYLQRNFSMMGLLAGKDARYFLKCTIVSSSRERISTPSSTTPDQYRLNVRVHAQLTDHTGKKVWDSNFADFGTFSEGGQDEDALDEASNRISLQIARAATALNLL